MNRLFGKLREAHKFLDEKLFDQAGFYTIYRCKSVRTNRLISAALTASSGYYCYRLVAEDDDEEYAGNLLLASLSCIAFTIHAYRMRRALRRLVVQKEGPSIVAELYDWVGMRTRVVQLGSEDLYGLSALIDRRLKMPILLYKHPQTSKRGFMMYKTEGIEDREAFELVCRGVPFKVLPKEMQVEAKKKRML